MKSKKLLLFAVVAAFAVITLPAAAQLGPWGLPWGTYAFTGDDGCLGSSGFDPATLTPTGPTGIASFSSSGTFTFNASWWKTVTGSGIANFTNVGYSTNPDGSGNGFSQTVTLPFTYTVGKDGALTVVPGTLSAIYITGPHPGYTFTKVGLAPFTGQIALNGSIVLTGSAPAVETAFSSSGVVIDYEICHRTRTLVPVLP
jgi:hypothetical protein